MPEKQIHTILPVETDAQEKENAAPICGAGALDTTVRHFRAYLNVGDGTTEEFDFDVPASMPDGPGSLTGQVRQPLTQRELELLSNLIDRELQHAEQCDRIQNSKMAVRQKKYDMERVALLRKLGGICGLIGELLDTELAEIACAGSLAPVEDILGRMKLLIMRPNL